MRLVSMIAEFLGGGLGKRIRSSTVCLKITSSEMLPNISIKKISAEMLQGKQKVIKICIAFCEIFLTLNWVLLNNTLDSRIDFFALQQGPHPINRHSRSRRVPCLLPAEGSKYSTLSERRSCLKKYDDVFFSFERIGR